MEGGENARAKRRACDVFFYQSVHDTTPTIHQMMCRPKAHNLAVSCPAAIYVDLSFVSLKKKFVVVSRLTGILFNVHGMLNTLPSCTLVFLSGSTLLTASCLARRTRCA